VAEARQGNAMQSNSTLGDGKTDAEEAQGLVQVKVQEEAEPARGEERARVSFEKTRRDGRVGPWAATGDQTRREAGQAGRANV
jgi:hypothetical protein